MLERSGFGVLRAASGDEALQIGAGRNDPIDLLLADVVMPGLSGPSLAERFTRLHPETQWLFMAGLPDQPEVSERIASRGHAFLPKPFLPDALIRKVREVLAARQDVPAPL